MFFAKSNNVYKKLVGAISVSNSISATLAQNSTSVAENDSENNSYIALVLMSCVILGGIVGIIATCYYRDGGRPIEENNQLEEAPYTSINRA